MKNVIIGTAGHIDHGKTALVRALTGIDTDRWEEEKRRGITIDIGFAHLALESGIRIGFVDVPGHERFVKNMLAGAGGVDLVMLVVAADESVMPQTREHFDICRLLNIRSGLVALTKIDLAGPDLVELVQLELADYLRGSFLESAPVIPVSAKTGAGLDVLRAGLEEAARHVRPKDVTRRFRLPIDRAFVMKGFGTVVTGTLWSGKLEAESEVEILPPGRRARVRGLQVHGCHTAVAHAGQRTAVNLAGIEVEGLSRGMVLAEPGLFQPTDVIEADLQLLSSAKSLKRNAPLHFHSGAAERIAHVSFLDGGSKLAPGQSTRVRFRFKDPVFLLPGDRFIVRRFSPVITIGGGQVTDISPAQRSAGRPAPVRLTGLPDPDKLAMLLAGSRFGLTEREIVARTGWLGEEIQRAGEVLESRGDAKRIRSNPLHWVGATAFAESAAQCVRFIEDFHQAEPLNAGAPTEHLKTSLFAGAPAGYPEALLASLVAAGKAVIEGDVIRLASHRVVLADDERTARGKLVSAFEAAGLRAPALDEVLGSLPVRADIARKILRGILREGELVQVSQDLVLHRLALDALCRGLAAQKAKSSTITVPQFKELFGVSRKYAIPLLEYLDRTRKTRRAGDSRVIL